MVNNMSDVISTTPEVRRQQILDAALKVFSERGFTRATNRDIARTAGIKSPGLIYHYFENKEDVLKAVLESFSPTLTHLNSADALNALPVEEGLRRIATGYLAMAEDPSRGACFRVLVAEAVGSQEVATLIAQIGPMRLMGLIAGFLSTKMATGELRTMDPNLAARCFLGPLMTYMFSRHLLRIPENPVIPSATIADEVIRIFLNGIAAE